MAEKTLRELCDSLGVSRRAVQGYEKAGLVSAEGKNERGYLLYSEDTQEKINQIKLYQQFGFTIKEIKWLMSAPACELKATLEKQVEKMKGEKIEMDALIEKAQDLINRL
ncbi:MAG: MerR family transcriptional regulator [Lachnospiraceae bacterium]|nr:MerR family transcriptional regulator [Lachnospiraceae bacterium]